MRAPVPILLVVLVATTLLSPARAQQPDPPDSQPASDLNTEDRRSLDQWYEAYCRKLATGDGLAALAEPCKMALSSEIRYPDFICDQTTRRRGRTRDVITAEVRYVAGRESYSNVEVNGHKPWEKEMLEFSGMTAIGEFGTMLRDVFRFESHARFKFVKQDHSLLVFEFQIDKDASNWLILRDGFGGKVAYEGRLWVDQTKHSIVALEQHGDLPSHFPFPESSVRLEFAEVELGDRGIFLLPARAVSSACVSKPSKGCFVNKTVFRNYRKFTVSHLISQPARTPANSPAVKPQ